ncbi:hypothetical protein SEA_SCOOBYDOOBYDOO_67 [Mycobacterium phage ScoobyDoobyDoo]|nr:hypothetical protein SEA_SCOOBYDOOBYDOO_67 [Mycobacterium phage ScoobyDoobyDoo]
MTLRWHLPAPGIGEEQGGAFMKKKTIYIQLFGGEQDGFETEMEVDDLWPETFYVYRNCDTKRINDARNPDLKKLLVDNLSILAYRFVSADPRDGVKGGKVYRYERFAGADKSLKDPAV